ncbi:MAG: polyisoprenyl-teichoic acid--peptidoglycan teichoic acid transferase [Thermoanaerobaculia bacterium]|jgi:LCP family protein required for cell wall assembly|nr:polyisoprenyl-teichoic acid--peptidoglycan teichoic acid transferase [Thermoanaerobaculia bacterium]
MASDDDFDSSHSRHTRWRNPDGSGRFVRPAAPNAKPTRSQSAVELTMFVVAGVLISLALVALYTSFSPSHKVVPNRVAEGLKDDRVNIVLFGVGGDNHPSHDNLADSIMLVSLKPSTKQAALVSVPRDLWVHMNGHGTHRLNYAHALGEQSGYPGAGPGLLCDTLSGVFQQPIHAFVRVDFAAFEKLINNVGGVDVYCQHGFYDYLFRDGFVSGWHHLDGKRALAYSRYRYVIGFEGDNYARELRQQQVINALRDKVQRLGPQQALSLLQAATTLSSATKTNLTPPQLLSLYRTFHDIKPDEIRHISLKPLTEPFDVTGLTEPGEAVRARVGNFAQLQRLESSIFSSERQISTDDQIQFAATPPPPQQNKRQGQQATD